MALATAGVLLLALLAFVLTDVRRAGDPDEAAEVLVQTPVATDPLASPTVDPAAPALALPHTGETFHGLLQLALGSAARLRYHAAIEARDAGEYALAAERFTAVAASSSPLAPMAALRAAQMLGLAGDLEAAADAYTDVVAIDDALPPSLRAVALMDAADAFLQVERVVAAQAALLAVESVDGVFGSTLAEARWQRAALLQEDRDPAWVDLALLAMQTSPTSSAARDALDALEAAEIAPPGMLAATVEYRGFRNVAADERLRALLDAEVLDAEEQATAWFYLGAIAERFGDREGALEAYANSLAANPDSALADDAVYWRGRVSEELGRAADAVVEYDTLVATYPGSDFVPDARLRAGVATGFGGNVDDALARLGAIAVDGGATAAEAARWHSVLLDQSGRTDIPPVSAAAIDPISYAAVLERSGAAAATSPFPASAQEERAAQFVMSEAVSAEVEAWLLLTFGARERPEVAALDEPRVLLALELARAGERSVAGDLLFAELNARRGEPYELLDLAFAALDTGMHDVAMGAATRILGPLSSQQRLAAPRPLLMLAYPAPFHEETHAAAEAFGVPPLLLLALVRQESAFNPRAGSSAGAFGLTQVIEPTGASIAAALGEEWSFEGLAEPKRALRYGAYYLGEQLSWFDGHLLAALAAYNGGPGNAAYWLDVQPFGGADGFIHAVEFVETRLYLELVMENYAMYRYIYAGVPAPSLP